VSELLNELYQDILLDHNKSPRNFRIIENAKHHCKGHNPLCGDDVEVFVDTEDGKIVDISFQGQGCAVSKASASLMTEALHGLSKEDSDALFNNVIAMLTGNDYDEDLMKKLGPLSTICEFPVRVKCATLPWRTFEKALADEKVATTEEE
jgi:nitrogen fixation NifU-like protein